MKDEEPKLTNSEQNTENTITVKLQFKTIKLLQDCAEQDNTTIDELLDCFIQDRLVEYITC